MKNQCFWLISGSSLKNCEKFNMKMNRESNRLKKTQSRNLRKTARKIFINKPKNMKLKLNNRKLFSLQHQTLNILRKADMYKVKQRKSVDEFNFLLKHAVIKNKKHTGLESKIHKDESGVTLKEFCSTANDDNDDESKINERYPSDFIDKSDGLQNVLDVHSRISSENVGSAGKAGHSNLQEINSISITRVRKKIKMQKNSKNNEFHNLNESDVNDNKTLTSTNLNSLKIPDFSNKKKKQKKVRFIADNSMENDYRSVKVFNKNEFNNIPTSDQSIFKNKNSDAIVNNVNDYMEHLPGTISKDNDEDLGERMDFENQYIPNNLFSEPERLCSNLMKKENPLDIVDCKKGSLVNRNLDFYQFGNSSVLLTLFHPCSLYFIGILEIEILLGTIDVLGYTLDKSSGKNTVYSPRGLSNLCITTKESPHFNEKFIYDLSQYGIPDNKIFDLKSKCSGNDVILILRKDTSNLSLIWPKFVEKYSSHALQPQLNLQHISPIEIALHCTFQLHSDSTNLYNSLPEWESIFHQIGKTGKYKFTTFSLFYTVLIFEVFF